MATIREVGTPASGNTNWYSHYQGMTDDVLRLHKDAIYLDALGTGSDDTKLTAAMTAQQSNAGTSLNYPPIILPNRPLSFTIPRSLYSGLKIVGPYGTGQKNPELAGGNYVGPEVTLGGTIGNGTSSWWNGTGSIYDVYMADFSVQGSQGSGVHQFLDQPSGTLYACEFQSLSFNFMGGVFGNDSRKCLMTQVALTGSWTMNNAWGTQINAGGSDCIFFMDSFNNIGVSGSSAQTGSLTKYFLRLDSLEAQIGKIYISTMNGWRGILISGAGTIIDMHGSIIEGFKPTRQNGLLSGPGPGSQVKITGGVVSMHGCKIGQGLDNPDVTEQGLLDISGGEVSLFGVNFYGANMDTGNGNAAAIYHTGGRLYAAGITKRQNITLAGRPRIITTATAGTGAFTYYCPDGSLGDVPITNQTQIPAGGTTGQALLKATNTNYDVTWGAN
jgi:hypothetical protein